MTSQVAIMNLNGIAVASDTVATHRSESGDKTTTNSEKIYPLGPKHKVVALHYGSTGLNDLNHQFHFNRWVETLGEPLPQLSDYVDDYFRFAEEGPTFHSPGSERVELQYLLRNHYQYLRKRMIDEAPVFEADNPTTEAEQGLVYREQQRILREGLEYLQSLDKFDGVDETWASAAFKKIGFKPKDVWADVFEDFAIDSSMSRALNKHAAFVISRQQSMPFDSYLAFVGFGEDEVFASSQVLLCRSLISGKFLAAKFEPNVIGPGDKQSEIITFAQDEAITAFLYGYNKDIKAGFEWAIGKHVAASMGDDVDWDVVSEIQANVMNYVGEHSWRRYVKPILNLVAGMNIFAIGQLAETLVKIQATSSEATDGPASVGGLIEVLTIDRINGVQWKVRLPR